MFLSALRAFMGCANWHNPFLLLPTSRLVGVQLLEYNCWSTTA